MRTRPRFEILWEARLGAWADDLGAIFARAPRQFVDARPLSSSLPKMTDAGRPSGVRARGLLASLAVHACGVALLSHASFAARVTPVEVVEASSDPAPIYLDLQALKELKILRALPVVRPGGMGGRPGNPARVAAPQPQPALDVPLASTVQNPKFTIVVNPLKPENRTQAIRQSIAPPDLKIKLEQPLPDILLDDEPAPAAPKPQVDLQMHAPAARDPVLDPVLDSGATAPAISAAAPAPELPMKITATVPQPKMPASYFTAESLRAPRQVQAGAPRKNSSVDSSADAPSGIVVLSAQPAAFSELAALAQGNRYGALAVAPAKPGPGSPGGKPGATAPPSPNGAGAGGDTSAGVGPGNSGGGGAQLSAGASFSAVGGSGKAGGVDANGLLGPVLPATVFPVMIAPKLRRAPLIISAGPIGGGGLDVYGALTCGKVYSIFLPMPGKNWALQYCQRETGTAAPKPAPPPSAGVVRMEAGIVPPSPEQQFDFRRLPVPDKDADKLIILEGVIGTDGAVSDARVFRGVLPAMDAAAAQAFGNWKFKPATRAGAPVALDVLVGVPARLPEKTSEASPETSIAR